MAFGASGRGRQDTRLGFSSSVVTVQLPTFCSQSLMPQRGQVQSEDGGCLSIRACGPPWTQWGVQRGWGEAAAPHRAVPQVGLAVRRLVTGTCLRGNGFCLKRDRNLFGQLIHHFKPLLLLSGLPSRVCSKQALLTWAEKAPGCQRRFNSSLSKMNVRSWMLVQAKNSPAAPASASSQLGLCEYYDDSHVKERLMDFFLEAIKK